MSSRSLQPFYLARDYETRVFRPQKHLLDIWPARPLFDAREFSSLGWRTTAWSWLVESVLETVSMHEFNYVTNIHVEPGVSRIRCQQALEYPETRRIAESLGFVHPRVREGDIIMSTDFVVYTRTNGVETPRAVAVKRLKDLNERTLQKLRIERKYWLERGIEFRLALDTNINPVITRNVLLVWGVWRVEDLPCSPDTAEAVLKHIVPHLEARRLPYAAVCQQCDRALGLSQGVSLKVAHHAMIRRLLPVDFEKQIVPHRPLPLILSEQ